jgi:hypothetical protein
LGNDVIEFDGPQKIPVVSYKLLQIFDRKAGSLYTSLHSEMFQDTVKPQLV